MRFSRMVLSVVLLCVLLPISVWSQVNIAVLEFKGKGVSNVEASALTDRLIMELFRTGKFTVLEREQMDKILEEQGFSQSGCVDTECIVNIGMMVGVEQIVGGSVSKVGEVFSISAKLISVETGKIVGVAFYDYRGALGELLMTGMRNVAMQLAEHLEEGEEPVAPATLSMETPAVEPQIVEMAEEDSSTIEAALTEIQNEANVEAMTASTIGVKHPWTPLSAWPDLSFGDLKSDIYGIRVVIIPRRNHNVIGLDAGTWGGVDGTLGGISAKLVNTAKIDMTGVNVGVLYSKTGQNANIINIGGLYNHVVGRTNGLQIGIINRSNELWGIQAGTFFGIGLFNDVRGRTIGAQVAVINRSKELYGIQAGPIFGAGLFNDVEGKAIGLQVNLVNRCDELKGLQVGLWNVNRNGKGLARALPIINIGW